MNTFLRVSLRPRHGQLHHAVGKNQKKYFVTERSVACYPADKTRAAHMRGALGGHSSLEAFSDLTLLTEAIRAGSVDATVVIVDLATFDKAEAALRRIHASFESHPLVAYYDPRGITPRHILSLAQSGITDLVQLDVDDSKILFGKILDSAARVSHARTLVDLIGRDMPVAMRSVFSYALEHAGRSMDVPELAASLGLSKRTLAWRMNQQGLPSPRIFLTWCRLLVAALLLNERGRTLDSVAEQLDFSGGHSLGAVFFRYMDRGIMTLRDEGVLAATVEEFRLSLTGKRPPPPSLPTSSRGG